MVCCAQSLTRDIGGFDKALLDANSLINNLDITRIAAGNDDNKEAEAAAEKEKKKNKKRGKAAPSVVSDL